MVFVVPPYKRNAVRSDLTSGCYAHVFVPVSVVTLRDPQPQQVFKYCTTNEKQILEREGQCAVQSRSE